MKIMETCSVKKTEEVITKTIKKKKLDTLDEQLSGD